jgi:methionyl-tRNA synthetase
MSNPKYYLTTPVFDASAGPDVGTVHTAILCDAIARHKRMCGFDVAHLVGSDAHGANLEDQDERAPAARTASLQQNSRKFEELLNLVDVHATHFQNTYSPGHILAVQTLLRRILRRSRLAIYKGQYQGRFCLHDQIDVSESPEPADCSICGRTAVLVSEERYFFRLFAFQGRLMALYKYRPEFIQPQFRLDEITTLVARGLKDIPVSRKSSHPGIPWPDDPEHIVAGPLAILASYLSGIGFGEDGYGSDEFKRFWPANLHVIGKAALHSHAINWSAFLMAADLPLPRHVFAHPALILEHPETDKGFFSERIVQALGSDAMRYYLLREVAYRGDTCVALDGLVRRYNADLAKDLARLAHRIVTLVARHCDGKIPTRSLLSGIDQTLEIVSADIRAEVRFLLDNFDFSEALKKIWSLVATLEKLLSDNVPCELSDDSGEKRQLTDALHDACEGLGWLALLLHPILPRATAAIWKSLGQTTPLEVQQVDETPWTCLVPGTPIGKPEVLFPEMDHPQGAASPSSEIDSHRSGIG